MVTSFSGYVVGVCCAIILLSGCSPARQTQASITTKGTGTAITQTGITLPTSSPARTSTVLPATSPPAQTTETASAAGPSTLRVALLGDIRTSGMNPPAEFGPIISRVAAAHPDLVLSLGDLINADIQARKRVQQWHAFVATAQPALDTHPFRPCLGNHETNGAMAALDEYRNQFVVPANGPPGFEDLTFSFDQGLAHFVCLSTETPGSEHQLGAVQLDWLAHDLATTQQPYVFVYSHDPAYPVGPHIGSSLDATPRDRDQLWSLLKHYQVSAYLVGHEHLYNRQVIHQMTQVILGTSGSDIHRDHGGEFRGYGLLDISATGATLQVFDDQGTLRDTAQFAPRKINAIP